MASGTLAPAPWFVGLDDNGNPVAGGKLFTYLAGTTTKQATYSDVGLTTPNANPIVLDAGGRAIIYLSPGASYKFVLSPSTDTDPPTNPIKTADNINAIPASSSNLDIQGVAGEAIGAGQGVYLSDGSGGKTAGLWYLWDADFTYASTLPEIGMATAAIASLSTGTIRLGGQVTGLSGLTVGTSYYISATAGALTATPPANQRFVGTADSTTTLVLRPRPVIGGVDTQVQFNDGGALGGDAGLVYNKTTDALTVGSLVATLGQIAFPATQNASSGANTLDDYEEGFPAWTPVIGGSGGTSGQTYATQNGWYIKIGRLVIASFTATLTAKGTITTSVQIQGLPFTVAATTQSIFVGSLRWVALATTWTSVIAIPVASSTAATLIGTTVAATGNNTALTTTDIGNSTEINGTIIYFASA